jgi:hypothetical protein
MLRIRNLSFVPFTQCNQGAAQEHGKRADERDQVVLGRSVSTSRVRELSARDDDLTTVLDLRG